MVYKDINITNNIKGINRNYPIQKSIYKIELYSLNKIIVEPNLSLYLGLTIMAKHCW